jgi:hypothetical protein
MLQPMGVLWAFLILVTVLVLLASRPRALSRLLLVLSLGWMVLCSGPTAAIRPPRSRSAHRSGYGATVLLIAWIVALAVSGR